MTEKWYVVAGADDRVDPDECYWTVSRNQNYPGWETDSGCHSYGLTKADAQFLADAANEKIARESKG